MRRLLAVIAVLVFVGLGMYIGAGRVAGPPIDVISPTRFIGTATPLRATIGAPRRLVALIRVVVEQSGTRTVVLSYDGRTQNPAVTDDGPSSMHVAAMLGPSTVPGLKSGPARIIVSATRSVLWGIRKNTTEVTRDVLVRLEPPRVSVISTKHYINLGGSEAIVYRVSPEDVESGVRVGDLDYPGFPAKGANGNGISITDPSIRIAFFALRWDQKLDTPMHLYARDEAGNVAAADFEHQTFFKPQKDSRIQLDDAFLNRVVPAILAGTKEIAPEGSLIDKFVAINGDLRQRNAARIASFAGQSSPEMLWHGDVFHPYTNSKAEAAFADHRTYIYQGREVDKQVHLGFDLASYANTPILAANRGIVLFAGELGIYGNAVIVDHGMGVQSLYGHLSSIDVKPGTAVEKGQTLGKSGMTGMAGGDHLHFTMLVSGQMVTPIEWWDEHWIQDRVLRKLRDAH